MLFLKIQPETQNTQTTQNHDKTTAQNGQSLTRLNYSVQNKSLASIRYSVTENNFPTTLNGQKGCSE